MRVTNYNNRQEIPAAEFCAVCAYQHGNIKKLCRRRREREYTSQAMACCLIAETESNVAWRQIPAGRRPGNARARDDAGQLLRYLAFPLLITAFVSLTSARPVSFTQVFLSYLLLQIACAAWVSWKMKPPSEKDFPLYAIIAGMYWLAYGLPLYWSLDANWRFAGGFASAQGVERAQLLALLGIGALYVGLHLGAGRRVRRISTLDLRDTRTSPKYVAAAMFFGLLLHFFPSIAGMFGSSFLHVFKILRGTLPLVAFAILLRRMLLRWVPLYERALLVLFVAGMLYTGLASGWLGTGAALIMVAGCVLLDTRFTVPKTAIIIVFAYILFLQPAKEQFRQTYWHGGSQAGGDTSRASDWISLSRGKWESVWSSSDPEAFRRQLYGTMGRFSLLQPTANVMDLTPSIVPYQGWNMYAYMAYTLIPRALWKEKPTVNEANRLYQVTYDITAERNLEGVSISVGMLTEAYISFGWIGAAVVMILVGVVLDCIIALLLSRDAGVLMKGIGMALLPGLAGVESQMAQYLGGLAQQLFLTFVVMAPIAVVRRRNSERLPAMPPRRVAPPVLARMRPHGIPTAADNRTW